MSIRTSVVPASGVCACVGACGSVSRVTSTRKLCGISFTEISLGSVQGTVMTLAGDVMFADATDLPTGRTDQRLAVKLAAFDTCSLVVAGAAADPVCRSRRRRRDDQLLLPTPKYHIAAATAGRRGPL